MDAALKEKLARRQKMLERIRSLLTEKLQVPREPDEIDPDTPLCNLYLTMMNHMGVEEESFGDSTGLLAGLSS